LGLSPKKRANRRFNSEFAVDQSKAIGNAWLELQYGWKPLLSDVYGSMETLAKANVNGNPNTLFQKCTGRAARKEGFFRQTNESMPSGSFGFSKLTRDFTFECYVRAGVTYTQSSASLQSLSKVGISNPLLLGWELLPYSFVVDWFLPIGNYLSSLDATNGLTFHSGYVTVFSKMKGTTFRDINYSYASGLVCVYEVTQENYEEIKCNRTTLAGFPSMPFPSFKNPLSTSHVASAMSLLLQTIKK
jgi:hypothetical protein